MLTVSAADYREAARRRLPRFLFDYIDGGSYAETTLARNRTDLEAIALRQRVMVDVSAVDLSVELCGHASRLPLILGPVGLAGLNARRGEVQAARAAATAGVPFCLSTVSVCTIEEVARTGVPFWFQLYMIRDRAFMRDLLARACEAGCTTLVFTVDMPMPGSRYRDRHSGLAGAPGWGGALRRTAQAMRKPAWAFDVGLRGGPHTLGNLAPVLAGRSGVEDFLGWMAANFDPTVTWADVEFVRAHWRGKILIKGVLDPDDARQAVAAGADAVVVSNHGGRQLDGAVSTARALPDVVQSVGSDTSVLVDGGVRSGLDVIRMLALGARGVLLGRAWAFALAAGGQAKVEEMLATMEAEMRVAMSLCGRTAIDRIDRDMLAT